jgi:hypothetical protein
MEDQYYDIERRTAIKEEARMFRRKFITYAEYRQAKQEMKDIQMAKYNVDLFLKFEEQKELAEKQKTTEQTQ